MTEPLLALDDVRAGYGSAIVLDGVSLTLPERGGLAVLGRNGVGKSTLLLTIMGYTQVGRGRILWRGEDITRRAPHRRALAGIGWVAQEREIFASLSVEENLTVAAREGRWNLEAVYDLFPRLAERRRNLGNQLSGGEQQMLAIARALMTNPALLLLDEPLEGLAPIVVEELAAAIRRMTKEGSNAFILVEQHAEIALSLTQAALVLERGRVVHSGASASLLADHAALDRLDWRRCEAAARMRLAEVSAARRIRVSPSRPARETPRRKSRISCSIIVWRTAASRLQAVRHGLSHSGDDLVRVAAPVQRSIRQKSHR
jgi:branched-chain amino acid transport system ATP-binding protein